MGEILVEGEDVDSYLDFLLTNDVTPNDTGQSTNHAIVSRLVEQSMILLF